MYVIFQKWEFYLKELDINSSFFKKSRKRMRELGEKERQEKERN